MTNSSWESVGVPLEIIPTNELPIQNSSHTQVFNAHPIAKKLLKNLVRDNRNLFLYG